MTAKKLKDDAGLCESIIINDDFDDKELAFITAKQKKDLSDSGFEDELFSMKKGPFFGM
jgi:hypothetical protein